MIADLAADLKKVRTELTGKELTTLNDEISKYWSGADANEFKAKIRKTVTEIDSQIKKMQASLEKDFDADTKSFAKMQSTNAATIGKL